MFEDECLREMAMNGLPFNGPLNSDGKIHRYSADHKKNQPDEWYVAYASVSKKGRPGLCCVYGSWSSGDRFEYRSWDHDKAGRAGLSEVEVKIFHQEAQLKKHSVFAEQEKSHAAAAKAACRLAGFAQRCGGIG